MLLLSYKRNVLLLKNWKDAHSQERVFNTQIINKMISTSNQNTEIQDYFFGIKFIQDNYLQKWITKLQMFSADVTSCILLFHHNLEAASPKYDNSWNKNFPNFKRLKESKADFAFSLNSRVF